MTELRECPFCGGAEYVVQYRHGLQGHRWTECTECDAQGPVVVGLDAAISAWNRRADDWQPIETAPMDGAYMLKNRLGEVCPCQSRDGQRIVSNMPGYADWTRGEPATHWRPFQAGPTGASA